MKKLLIVGSEGFIGGHLTNYFISNGFDVFGCDLYEAPTRNYHYTKVSRLSPEWDDLFASVNFEFCINSAGSGNVPYSVLHPLIDFEANTLDVIRLLDAIRRHQPDCRYLHISSAAVYGNPRLLPVKETDPKCPLSPYGWHKLISEQLCNEYSGIYNLRTAIVRPFSVYGPGLRKQIFWDLFQKIKKADGMIELFGTGNESRDFIYVEDLVRGIAITLKNAPMEGEEYNLATGVETFIHSIVQTFLQFLGRPCHVSFNQEVRKGDPLNWRADISKLTSLGFTPGVDIINGLQRHVAWLKSEG